MASSSGTYSVSLDHIHKHSGSEEGLQNISDQKKRKRMVSNRESARRSRMRKQKHLDDLLTQVSQLTGENSHMITSMKLTGQMYVSIDTENSILKALLAELTHRLDSLNQVMDCLNSTGGSFASDDHDDPMIRSEVDCFLNPWSSFSVNQPIMAYPIV